MSVSVLEEHYIEIAGRRLRYLIGGRGKPLVLCHGWLSSAEEFGGRFSALVNERTLIVPDLPGNAESEPLPHRHTAGAMADCVDTLLARLGIETLDLGGLCLGASVACALTRRRGKAVERLVLHTPLIMPRLVRASFRYQARFLYMPGIWSSALWLSRRRTISDLYKRCVIEGGHVDQRTSDVNFRNQLRADPRAAKEWLQDALQRDDLDLIARRIDPTLIITVQNDRLVDVGRLRRTVERLPHVTMYVDDEGGHGWNEGAVRRHLTVLQSFFGSPAAAPCPVHQEPA